MKAFPMFIKTTGRRVVVVGGGEAAAQKTRLLLKTDAMIQVHAPILCAELQELAVQGRISHQIGSVTLDSFANAALTFIATGCAGADTSLHHLAKQAGALVNVVDRPDLCDAITPSIVDRDPVVVAIGTEGTAPVLGRSIKTQIEQMLAPRLGQLASLAGSLRGAVGRSLPQSARRDFWAWVFKGTPARLHLAGDEAAASALLEQVIRDKQLPEGAGHGHIALVAAGPGARDLLTLRAVQRLQEADVIYYDQHLAQDILELARRDAQRVCVSLAPTGETSADTLQRMLTAARSGQRVVLLRKGEIAPARVDTAFTAAHPFDVSVEIVPGVGAENSAQDAGRFIGVNPVPPRTGRLQRNPDRASRVA